MMDDYEDEPSLRDKLTFSGISFKDGVATITFTCTQNEALDILMAEFHFQPYQAPPSLSAEEAHGAMMRLMNAETDLFNLLPKEPHKATEWRMVTGQDGTGQPPSPLLKRGGPGGEKKEEP